MVGKDKDHIALLNYSTGWADAPLWADIGNCRASGAIGYELGLVCEDCQRHKRQNGKHVEVTTMLPIVLSIPTCVLGAVQPSWQESTAPTQERS